MSMPSVGLQSFMFLCLYYPSVSAEALCLQAVWLLRSSVYLFIRTNLVTVMFHECLEQCRRNLQGIFNSPCW